MSFVGLICILCSFIDFAYLSESQVVILRDYEDLIPDHAKRSSAEALVHQKVISPDYKPKSPRRPRKKTIVHYGRHIFHLDHFDDLKKLRSTKFALLNPDPLSYDYVDIKELIRSTGSTKNGIGGNVKDIYILSDTPLHVCNERECDEDLRKFSHKKKKKIDDDDLKDWRNKKMAVTRMKRFQIISNRHEHLKTSSEEYHKKKRKQSKRQKKKKKKRYSSESTEKSSESWETNKRKKKKHKSSEESVETKRKRKKDYEENSSASASFEKWKSHEEDSKSSEEFHKKKKKNKKKKRHVAPSDETKRKTFANQEDFIMQGNKIYHTKLGRNKNKWNDYDRRRRLEHFLPKRYHWNPADIHDLGYFWFNGPKGIYPEPRPLSI